jgi:hypothetical protein
MTKAKIIPPAAYPQMVERSHATDMVRMLRSPAAIARGVQAIKEIAQDLRLAVRHDVRALEQAFGDKEAISERAHEIRGLSHSAELPAAGRIADGLCRYLEEMDKLTAPADDAVIALHVSAILRAAFAEEETPAMSGAVADELALLVRHKLQELKKR